MEFCIDIELPRNRLMNQEIKVGTVLWVLLLFFCLLFAKFWVSSASKSIMTYSYLHQHPDGSHFIKLNDQLFGFDIKGQFNKVIDLSKFKVQEHNASDFAFFSNGDLLVRRQSKDKNVIENLQRYFRFTNPTEKISSESDDGLFRCHIFTSECVGFTNKNLNLNEAFSLAIDWTTDRVFVADTSRHTITMFSSDGKELDSAKNFKFPNQIDVSENKLYVADTNHHRIIALDISSDHLGELQEVIDIRIQESRKSGEIWPSAFMLLANERWVINNKNDMKDGGVYIFDEAGEFIKKLLLPINADPFALLKMGKFILISDFSQDRIYRYTLDGELQDDFNSPLMQNKLRELAEHRAHYDFLDKLFSIIIVVCLAIGFCLALYQQHAMKKSISDEQVETAMTNQLVDDEPVLHWIKPSTTFMVVVSLLILMFILLFLLLAAVYWFIGSGVAAFFTQTWRIQILGFVTIILLILQLKRRIGVTENTLTIKSPLRANIVCPNKEIISSDDFVVIGRAIFKINQLCRLFSAKDVENYLYPAIKKGQQVDRQQMQVILANKPWIRILQIITVIMLVGMFLYYGVLR